MRGLVVVLLCALSLTARAQIAPLTPQMLVPSPLGVVIMVGQWLMQDQRRVYYYSAANAVNARHDGCDVKGTTDFLNLS